MAKTGGINSRKAVIEAFDFAMKDIENIFLKKKQGKFVNIDYILDAYDDIFQAKQEEEDNDENIIPYLINSTYEIQLVFSCIKKELKSEEWVTHYHSYLIVGFLDENKKMNYIKFNHIGQFIQIYYVFPPIINSYNKINCMVKRISSKTLGDVVKMAILHWYAVNALKHKYQWPTSCSGFTDLLMYYIYYKDFDILSKCPLTIQSENKTGITLKNNKVHHIYTDPMIAVSCDDIVYVNDEKKMEVKIYDENLELIKYIQDSSSDYDNKEMEDPNKKTVLGFKSIKNKSPQRRHSRHRKSSQSRHLMRKSPQRRHSTRHSKRKSPQRRHLIRKSPQRRHSRRHSKRKS